MADSGLAFGGQQSDAGGGIGFCGYILWFMSMIVIICTQLFPLGLSIKVVQEYERALIFVLGRLLSGGAKGPALVQISDGCNHFAVVQCWCRLGADPVEFFDSGFKFTKGISICYKPQAQSVSPDLISKMFGNRVACSPIVTVEPRRRKFHKYVTLTIPAPKTAQKGMKNQYPNENSSLRLLWSITGEHNPAIWEDITHYTTLQFVNDCVFFTTSVSARFWLMDCQNTQECVRMATELYKQAITEIANG